MRAKVLLLSENDQHKQVIIFELDGDIRGVIDDLKGQDADLTLKPYTAKRSLDANAMLWRYCQAIAKATGTTKEEVYRDEIRQVGEYTPMPIRADAVEAFDRIWRGHGVGWFTEVIDDSKLDGYKLVFAYHGSSIYGTKQMSRLIDNVLQDAKALGIETMSERERTLLINEWEDKKHG